MKRAFILILLSVLAICVTAAELVLIPIKSIQEKQALFNDNSLTIHFYTNSFVVATSEKELKESFILLDQNPWQESHSYYIVFTDNSIDLSELLSKINSTSEVLYNGSMYMVVKTDEVKNGQLTPVINDGLIRIQNIEAKLPDYSLATKVVYPSEADPFIEDLLSEVNTSNITTSVQTLQDFGTRDAYSSQSFDAQNWISDYFEDLGLDIEVMDFYMPGGEASNNVIAKQVGTTFPTEFVVVGGHYDSYSSYGLAPGADDNASGTSGVMEIARILSNYEFDRSIIYCAFSGEEYGLYGSAAYANRSSQMGMDIIGYINLDMIGYLQPGSNMISTLVYPQSAQELADFYTAVCSVYLPNLTIQPGTLTNANSDHYSFNVNGYMGIFPFENLYAYSPYIHTPNDIVGTSYNSEVQAGVFTKAALASVAIMATDGLSSVPTQNVSMNIYPNPANEFVTVKAINGKKSKLEVFNTQGQLVYSELIDSSTRIEVNSWSDNIYIFRLTTPDGVSIKRVVKY